MARVAKETMLNTQKKELEQIYNKVSDANKNEGTLIYNEMLFMLDTLETLKTEIKQNGATEHFIQGKQNFLRESPSLSAYNKLMKTYDTFYKNLTNLIPKDDIPTANNGGILSIDDFMFEFSTHLSNMEVKNEVDTLDIDNPRRQKITQDEYKKYLKDPKGYNERYNELEMFLNE